MSFKIDFNHKTIMFLLSTAAFIHNIVTAGIMNVIISSLQKEFFLSSKDTGIYISLYDIGSLVSSIVVPIMGTRGSKPRWISFGMTMLSLGCLLTSTPHFFKSSPSPLFQSTVNHTLTIDGEMGPDHGATHGIRPNQTGHMSLRLNSLKFILYASNIVMGMSSSSIATLAYSYIEDVTPVEYSTIYQSIYYACCGMGMGVGFMVTSQFLNIFTDFDRLQITPTWMKPDHPNWIGAWWLPFIIFGLVSAIFALIICMFPDEKEHKKNQANRRNQKDKNNKHSDLQRECDEFLQNNNTLPDKTVIGSTNDVGFPIGNSKHEFKQIFQAALKLVRNPVFTCICIAAAIEGLLQNSFVAFTTLFIEYQYRLSSGFSSLISGALAVPALIIGSLLSGFIIKRYDFKMKECLIYLCVLLFLNLSAYTGYLFSCQEPRFIFNDECLTQTFENTITDKIGSNRSLVLMPQTHCKDCDPTVFKPVCMKDSLDIVFESACLAGCLAYDKHTGYYSNCSYAQAISDRISTIKSNVSLVNGLCELPDLCGYKLYLEYIAIVLVLFFTGLIYIPYMKITFGCVADMPEMNAIALGIKQLAMVGVGTIPGPIVFGAVIDLSCKYWYTDALGQKVCKVYNNNSFAYSVGFMGIGFKLLCLILISMALGFFNRPKRPKTSL